MIPNRSLGARWGTHGAHKMYMTMFGLDVARKHTDTLVLARLCEANDEACLPHNVQLLQYFGKLIICLFAIPKREKMRHSTTVFRVSNMNDELAKLAGALIAVILFGAVAGIVVVLLVKYGKLRPSTAEDFNKRSLKEKITVSLLWAAAITSILFVCSYALALMLILLSNMNSQQSVANPQYFFWLVSTGFQFFVALVLTFIFRELASGNEGSATKKYRFLGIVSFILIFSASRAILFPLMRMDFDTLFSSEFPLIVTNRVVEAIGFPVAFFFNTMNDYFYPFRYVWYIVANSNGNQFIIADRLPDHAALLAVFILLAWGISGAKEILSSGS